MADLLQHVEAHYSVNELGNRILDALKQMGKDRDALTIDDLAPVDEFHIRGRPATEELLTKVTIEPGMKILDVGCGLGGTSRLLASKCKASVTGIDLTPSYINTAEMLSEFVGMNGRTTFLQGSALQLPFEDGDFDLVWTEHVQMNIEDKALFYGELARVLKPGGTFVFYDIFKGENEDTIYPVPWADSANISFLILPDELQSLLPAAGFNIRSWHDQSETSIAWFNATMKRIKEEGPSPVGLHLLMGDKTRIKFSNLIENMQNNAVVVVDAVLDKQNK